MNEPIVPSSELVVAQGVQEVRANAGSLDIQWGLRFATVVTMDDSQDNVAMVVMDDARDAPVPALSLIGVLAPDDRVSILQVPPSGAYVLSRVTGARMGVELQRAALQALPDLVNTHVSWDTAVEDTHDMWSSGTTVTIPTGGSGVWAITFGYNGTANTTGRSLVIINPSAGIWSGSSALLRNSFGANEDTCTIAAVIRMNEGDTFTCSVFADMAGAAAMVARVSAFRVSL